MTFYTIPFTLYMCVCEREKVLEWSSLACLFCLVFYMALLIIMLLILSKRSQGQTINLVTVSLEMMPSRLSVLSYSHSLHLHEIKLRLALPFSLFLSIIVKNYLLVFFLNRVGRSAIRQEIMAWRLAQQTLHYNASRLDWGEDGENSH